MKPDAKQAELQRIRERVDAAHEDMMGIIDDLGLSTEERISLRASIYEFARCHAREWELQILSEKEIR